MDLVTEFLLMAAPVALCLPLGLIVPDYLPAELGSWVRVLAALPGMAVAVAIARVRQSEGVRAMAWVFPGLCVMAGGLALWLEVDRLLPFIRWTDGMSGQSLPPGLTRWGAVLGVVSWPYAGGGMLVLVSGLVGFGVARQVVPNLPSADIRYQASPMPPTTAPPVDRATVIEVLWMVTPLALLLAAMWLASVFLPPAIATLVWVAALVAAMVAGLVIARVRQGEGVRLMAWVFPWFCVFVGGLTLWLEADRLLPLIRSTAGMTGQSLPPPPDLIRGLTRWGAVLGVVSWWYAGSGVVLILSSLAGFRAAWRITRHRPSPSSLGEAIAGFADRALMTVVVLTVAPVAVWLAALWVAPDLAPTALTPLAHVLSPLVGLGLALSIAAVRPTVAAQATVWLFAVFCLVWGIATVGMEWGRLSPFVPRGYGIEAAAAAILALVSWQCAAGGFAMVLVGIVGIRLARRISRQAPRRQSVHPAAQERLATARLAERRDTLALLRSQRGLVLGEWRGNRPDMPQAPLLRWDGVGSLLTFAPPGKGKGVSVIGPALLTYDGPIVCFDPKGENAATWAYSRLQLGHQVAVLNPFDIPEVNVKPARFNPLDLVHDGRHFLPDVRVITDAIVVHDPTDKGHFYDLAKKIIGAVVAFVCAVHEGRYRTLTAVYALLQGNMREFDDWAEWIVKYPEFADGVPSAGAGLWLQVSAEERGSFYSTLTRHVDFLMDRNIQEALSESTFDMATLLRGDLDLFICLPDWAKTDYSRFVRLFVTLAVNTVMRADRRPAKEVLFLLDELSVMGRLNPILNPDDGGGALTVGRAAGIKVWGIIQSPANLALCYGENGLKTWKGSCSVLQVFGVAKGDLGHSEEISKLVGETVIEVESTHEGSGSQRQAGQWFGGSSANTGVALHQQRRWIMTPDEIRRLPADQEVLLVDDVDHPVLCHRAVYFDRVEWRYQYGVNPYYDGPQPYALSVEQQAAEYPDMFPPKTP